MTKKQKDIILGLLGILLFCIPLFRSEIFVQSNFTVLLMKTWVTASVLLTVVPVARLLKIRWYWLIAPILIVEISVFTLMTLAKKNREIGAPLLYFAKEIYSTNERNIPSYNENLGRYDSDLFYTLKPGVHTFKNLEFSASLKVNKDGFRDDEASMQQPSIVCLGDSYTMGWGVDEGESFPDLLEKDLGFKVMNLGMASYGTARELVAFRKFAPQDCELIVLQYCGNDDEENEAFVDNDFRLEVSPESVYRKAQLKNKLWRSYFPLKYFYATVSFCAREGRRWLNRSDDIGQAAHSSSLVSLGRAPARISNFFKILSLIKDSHVGKIIVLPADNYDSLLEFRSQFESWLVENPMEGVYIFPTDMYLSTEDYFVLDDHLSPLGHRKLAEALAEFIRNKHIFD